MKEYTKYYLIKESLVGKEEQGVYWLFRDNEWVLDKDNVIMDRIMGYDPYEPSDSPYAIGCMSIMDELEDISYERAMELTGGKA